MALQAQIDPGEETRLHLTDDRSLWVGHLGEVTADDVVGETPGEADHVPSYVTVCWPRRWRRG